MIINGSKGEVDTLYTAVEQRFNVRGWGGSRISSADEPIHSRSGTATERPNM
jgi:hypothetical protein